jgi:hypothetical protein
VKEYKLPENIEALQPHELKKHALGRAECIVANTQGDSWDDPEDWMIEAVEPAHVVYRLLSSDGPSGPDKNTSG